MVFKSRWTVDIPNKDLLSFVFGELSNLYLTAERIAEHRTDDWKHGWDRPLFVDADDPSQSLKAGEFLSAVKKIGRGLREGAGVQTGDVVMMCSANRVVTPALVLGIICAGATMSGANPSFSNKGAFAYDGFPEQAKLIPCLEISYQIGDCGAKVLFAADNTLDKVLECSRGLGMSDSQVYLLTLEKGPKRGIRTLGDLLEFGEMDWERITDKRLLQNR